MLTMLRVMSSVPYNVRQGCYAAAVIDLHNMVKPALELQPSYSDVIPTLQVPHISQVLFRRAVREFNKGHTGRLASSRQHPLKEEQYDGPLCADCSPRGST